MLLRFLLFFCVACSTKAAPHWQAPEYLVQAFSEIALRNEYTQQGQLVRRWQKPVNVWLDHQVADRELHTDLVRMHIKHLSQITGHPIRLVSEQRKANLTVVFTRQAQWRSQVRKRFGKEAEKVVHGAVCMANFRTDGRGEIIQADVIIPVDQARMHGKLVTCIVEEITQVMGLPNDSDKVYPSIFNDKTPEDLLSGLDYLLLKMLYQPQVEPGMDQREVRPLLKKLIRSWQQQGTISSAQREVKRGELYSLLGY